MTRTTARKTHRADDASTGSAALRSITVLELIAAADRALSLTEIMAAIGLPKPTVFRLLSVLTKANMVLREPTGKRYLVGGRLSRLALDALTNRSVSAERHGILTRLVQEIGETCNFTMLDAGDVLYLDRVEAAWPLRMHLAPGSRVPVHASASGKLLLACMPKAKRERLVAQLDLKGFTRNTLTDRARLERELAEIRSRGYSLDNEEFADGLVCVAVPVRDARGKMCAAVAVHAPVSRMTLGQGVAHLPKLQRAASALAQTFSHEAPAPAEPAKARKRAARGAAALHLDDSSMR